MNVLEGVVPVGAGLVVLLGLLLVEEQQFKLSQKSNRSIDMHIKATIRISNYYQKENNDKHTN
jgi:hypothetical protein